METNKELEKRIEYWKKLLNGDEEKARKNALKELEIDESNALASKSWYAPSVKVVNDYDAEEEDRPTHEDSESIIDSILGCGGRTYMVLRYPELSSVIDKISSCSEFVPVEEMGINHAFNLEKDKEKRPVVVDNLEDLIFLPYRVGVLGDGDVDPSLYEFRKSAEAFIKYIKSLSWSDLKKVRKEEERSYYTLLRDLATKFKEAIGCPLITGKFFNNLLDLGKVNWKDILFQENDLDIIAINKKVVEKYTKKNYKINSRLIIVLFDDPEEAETVIPIIEKNYTWGNMEESDKFDIKCGKLIDLGAQTIVLPLKLLIVKGRSDIKGYSDDIIEYVNRLQPLRKYFPIYKVDDKGNEEFIFSSSDLKRK